MDNVIVEVYEGAGGVFHFEFRTFKVPRTRLTPCGLNTKTLRHAAWFPPVDPKGAHHFERACSVCSDALVY